MAEYRWPEAARRKLLGKEVSRLDGPVKVTGRARYSSDVSRPGLLWAAALRCPHAHARVKSIDTAAAERMPGVKKVSVVQGAGAEIQWSLDEIAFVAAASPDQAEDAARAIKVDYEVLPHFVAGERPEGTPQAREAAEQTKGDPDAAMGGAEVRHRGRYGLRSIAHCCLEPHGQVAEWQADGSLKLWASTQAVSSVAGQFAEGLGVPASSVEVEMQYIGGGFGSKFSPDRWGIEGARLARDAKAPVKLFLDREAEIAVAGDRPSAWAEVEIGARRDGTIVAWSSRSWGSGGPQGSTSPPLPYAFDIPDRRHRHVSVPTNLPSARAWRAPNHPQGCLITLAALEDLAARLQMDPLDLLLKNASMWERRTKLYTEEFEIASRLMDWKKKWRPRTRAGKGPLRRGLGLSFHTWGGRGNRSNCEVVIHPDGAAEAKIATQDLGTGTRTVVAMVLAETLGLPLEGVKVTMGNSRLPAAGGSGGSTTVGGVSAATRRAAQDALAQVLAKAAPALGVAPERLEAAAGRIGVAGGAGKSLSWKDAVRLLGGSPVSATGSNPGPGELIGSGVGGVQMAEVSVDVDTGVVRVEKMVAVQDCGLIIDLRTAKSQVLGALIMGIAYAVSEEKIVDPTTGRLLNGNMEFYQLPGIGDVGELVVHMLATPEQDALGVIGLGEPPVISPGAAISNAVANAIGVRVPELPLTPDRVIAALESGEGA